MILKKKCGRCKQIVEIVCKIEDFRAWKNGELIQRAMPYLTADQRELLISGVCGKCFDKMCGKEV